MGLQLHFCASALSQEPTDPHLEQSEGFFSSCPKHLLKVLSSFCMHAVISQLPLFLYKMGKLPTGKPFPSATKPKRYQQLCCPFPPGVHLATSLVR